ncbi:MAG TPA: hypothetical protein VNN79_14300 [Actinomycetota bacterium]|nr:hypothetical protein [Actinomycetota bacterium]
MARISEEQFVVKTSPNSAAGAEVAFTAAQNLLVKTFHVALVTDANAANRQVHFTFEDAAGNVYARFVAGGTHAASLTRQYAGRPGEFAAPAVADTAFIIPIPNGGIYLPNGGKIKTVTTAIQVGDDYGVLTVSARY